MKTVFYDETGEKLKVRDYDVPIDKVRGILWDGQPVRVKSVIYDAAIDAKLVTLFGDLLPK